MLKKTLPGILLLIAILATSALQAAALPDFEAAYILKRGKLRIGTTTIVLQTGAAGSYLYGGRREREADLSFDWQERTVSNHVEGSLWEMDIPADTIDKLASQLGVMLALKQGKKDVTFNIADGGKLKEYRYKVVGHETLEVPAGTFATVKITKLRNNSRRETYVWCAPALNYLPIRIWQRETDDSEYTSDLESFSETLRIVP